MRLERFESVCRASRVFLPTALCETDYSLRLVEGGQPRTLEGKVSRDVGMLRVADDDLFFGAAFHREYDRTPIIDQAKEATDAVLEDIARQL